MSEDEMPGVSTGNIYADLGFDDPEGELLKADLAIEIIGVIRKRGLTQQQAAAMLGVGQPKVSAIMRGRLDGISAMKLIEHLNKLGQNVDITVSPAESRQAGRTTVSGNASHAKMAVASR